MGGNYYPGKDKKRKSMRRKTLWYKLFCSSSWRKVASTMMLIYILFWHALVPMTEWMLQMGKTMSRTTSSSSLSGSKNKNPVGDWLQFDESLLVPSLAEERSAVIHAASERARLQFGPEKRHEKRLLLLEALVPTWFHRNDGNFGEKTSADDEPVVNRDKALLVHHHEIEDHSHIITTDNNNKVKVKHDGGRGKSKTKEEANKKKGEQQQPKKEMRQPVEKKPDSEHAKAVQENMIEKQKEALLNNTTRTRALLTVTGNDRPLHTLQTMDSVGTNYSSCPSQISEQEWKTTIVTQTSTDRLWILKETCTRWKDPIVAVVFVPSDMKPDQKSALESFSAAVAVTCPHLQLIQYIGTAEESKTDHYPVNRLRNIGLDAVNTSHILVADVDFVPSKDLDETIRVSLKQLHSYVPGEAENHQAIIVPAFERKPPTPCKSESQCAQYLQTDRSFIPHTFEELEKCVGSEDCIVFQSDNNSEGHYSTNSEDWLQKKWYEDEDEEQKHFKQLECFHSMRYEPYVVIRWCPSSSSKPVAPHYDERFYGYGKNKIELISHLRFMGYRFSILPEGFIVHNPHPESQVKETWNDREGSDLHATMDKLYPKFLKELDSKYKQFSDSIVKPCKTR
jgi:hypothetical protein